MNFSSRFYSRRSGIYGYYLNVTNESDQPLEAPIRFLMAELSPSGATVPNADGQTVDGIPYYEFAIDSLAPGETTPTIIVTVQPPPRQRYSFLPEVHAVIASPQPAGSPATFEGEFIQDPPVTTRSVDNETDFPNQAYGLHPGRHLQNPSEPLDVNGDGEVSPLDALQVINQLARGTDPVPADMAEAIDTHSSSWVDVDGNGATTPRDALWVINHLARQSRLAESEWIPASLQDPSSDASEYLRDSDLRYSDLRDSDPRDSDPRDRAFASFVRDETDALLQSTGFTEDHATHSRNIDLWTPQKRTADESESSTLQSALEAELRELP
jgi:hypothetical protein